MILESFCDAISRESSSFHAGLFSLACDESITKKLFTTTIADKIYETMSRNQAKLDRTRKI